MTDLYFNFQNVTVSKIKEYEKEIVNTFTECLDNIVNVNGERTYNNTVQPLINMETLYEPMISIFNYALNLYTNKSIRDAGIEAEKNIQKFMIECNMRHDVYHAFAHYANNNYKNEQLDEEERRYFDHKLRDYRREGLHLDKSKRNELKEIKQKLSELSIDFLKNLNAVDTSFEYKRKDLDGMPKSWFTGDRLIDKEKDLYRVTLKYPDIIPALKYVKKENVRYNLYKAFNNRCVETNVTLLEQIIKLRYKLAKLLGYNTYADYKTEIKIVKNGENAYMFEQNLSNLLDDIYKNDIVKLTEFAKEYDENPLEKEKLEEWDYMYYERAYKERECDLDICEVQKYFPLETVKNGMFEIYQTVLGLLFELIDTENKWNKDITLYSVRDNNTKELLGYFYLDMYPREGKFAHAGVFNFMSGCEMRKINNQERRPHIVTMACNFPKNGNLSFDNVVTFFHEFGHAMHALCGKTKLYAFNGLNIEGDFVEAPSQMLENWCYDKSALELMSNHCETNEKLPNEIITKLKESKYVMQSLSNKKQLMYGLFDLKIHTLDLDANINLDVQKIWYDIEKEVLKNQSKDKFYKMATFAHLVSGYDAGYYGYMRSKTYAANMFHKWFSNEKTLSKENGMRYRIKLLEPGSSKDAMVLLHDFLGEEPNDSYFLKECGILDHKNK